MGEIRNEMNGGRSGEIRREIFRTEAEMADTIHTLEDRLSPSHLKQEAMEKIRNLGEKSVDSARSMMARIPPWAGAAGTGATLFLVSWMLKKKKEKRSAASFASMEGVREAAPKSSSATRNILIALAGIAAGAAAGYFLPKAREEKTCTAGSGTPEAMSTM